MFTVTFKGFETLEQAKVFADWYEGQGEQQSDCWLEEHSDINFACVENVTIEDTNIVVDLKLYKK